MHHSYAGYADQFRQRMIVGWAFDGSFPNTALVIQVVINGKVAGFSLADQFRSDLQAAGIGDGCHGFEFAIPANVKAVDSLDVFIANTQHRLCSDGLTFTSVNEYLDQFPADSTTEKTSDLLSDLFAPDFLNSLMKRGVSNATSYQGNSPFPFACFDDFLPAEILDQVVTAFPQPRRIDWASHNDGPTKRKLAFSAPEALPSPIRDVLYFLNSRPVLGFLECLTGIEGLIPDPYFEGGGLHQTESGGRLSVHIDFNRHNKLKLDRRLNLLLYLNKDWPDSYGGALELWPGDMSHVAAKIAPLFNRCVIFSTTEMSYHGHPDPLTCPSDRTRKSIALYYYTNGRPSEEVADPHLTVWKKRTGEY